MMICIHASLELQIVDENKINSIMFDYYHSIATSSYYIVGKEQNSNFLNQKQSVLQDTL